MPNIPTPSSNVSLSQGGVLSNPQYNDPPEVYTEDYTGDYPSHITTNPFDHAPANNTASSTIDYTLNFLNNSLDNYDVVTDHWKLFITSLENARSGEVLNKENQTIIVESGVSDLTIDKIEVNGIAVPSIEAGTGTQTTIKFEIVEPAGAGLLDKLFYQSVSLGIGNWFVMPIFLQLEFRTRDPLTGQSATTGSIGGINGGQKWLWPIKISDIKANVTQVGTRYEFETIMYDELAQSNSYFCTQSNIVLRGLSTFEDAIQKLQSKLNADAYAKLIEYYSIPDSFNIIVDPIILQNAILFTEDSNISPSRAGDYFDFAKKTASFSSGTSIDKIVDALLANTSYYQKLMQNSTTPSSEPNAPNQETQQMKKLWRIITETKPIAFDSLRQNNAIQITIYIVQYDLGAIDVSPAQTGQTPNTISASKRKVGEFVQKKILNKLYNYIFKGLNDQIVNLDLNLNFSYAAALSRFGGLYFDSSIQDIGVNQFTYSIYQQITEELRATLQFINDEPNNPDTDQKITEMQTKIDNGILNPTLRARYTNILQHAKSTQIKEFTTQLQTTPADGSLNALQAAQKNAIILAQPIDKLTFVSDVDINSSDAKSVIETAQSLGRSKMRPIPFIETNQENNVKFGIDPLRNPARSRVSSIFATALYSTLDASLQTLKLTVKGDPYWLFPRALNADQDTLKYKSNMPPNEAISLIKNTQDIGSVNLFGTDNFIIVRFRTPRTYNNTTGSTDPFTEVDTFSGVYKVITIISRFESGKFTQELSCILDPVIDLSDFLKEIEAASKTVDMITVPAPNPDVPTTVQKQQKFIGTNLLPGQSLNVLGTIPKNVGPIPTETSNIPDLPRGLRIP